MNQRIDHDRRCDEADQHQLSAAAPVISAFVAVALAAPCLAVAAPPQYRVTHLSPDLPFGVACAIDDDANIAGEAATGCGAKWTKSGIEWQLSTAAPDCGFPGFVIPKAISAGLIVGWASSGAASSYAFVIDDSSFALLPAGSSASASGVNAAGQVVGVMNMQNGFLFEHGAMSLLPEGSTANAIAADGVIVGSAGGHAALWSRLSGVWAATPLGLKGTSSVARAINASGQVAGEFRAEPNGPQHPFLWQSGQSLDLGTLGGTHAQVAGITASGDVIGSSDFPGEVARPFVWHNGTMYDLNDLAPSSALDLVYALGCNAQGQIVGWGLAAEGGASVPFVATPIIEGDINLDARVNGHDLGTVLGHWGPCLSCPADTNADGVVDGFDLATVLGNWTD